MPKFRFEGREWTPKDFKGAYMMQADYTRKTQALAEERKFYDNLPADLAAVKGNPQLAAEFRKVYPSKFHAYLDHVAPAQSQQDPNKKYAEIDPAISDRFNRVEAYMKQQQVSAINAELDARFKVMSEKYPYADEEAVIARAQAAHAKNIPLNDKNWDLIWKAVNDKGVEKYKQYGQAAVNKQRTANQKGKEAASGGGIPGQAPVKPKTIKEASKYALEEIMNS